ncbi:hypothetical protein [Pseudobutyrivibrio xylanivorans]|uniref:Uncharacterized protein n=1 Tax=Pseudobutyrivibrio xylanivorans TaxID=185007 RepID=A0A5P6VR80_PSEXY|nr:hypothetical protein [Pseudobutyrivibrio xylanivorans]QFJ55195.1 hypothetical protein FXF36_10140 [Pseudobutyrivibrio xylanivorans]
MKKSYKVVSLALAGALVASSFASFSVHAEDDVVAEATQAESLLEAEAGQDTADAEAAADNTLQTRTIETGSEEAAEPETETGKEDNSEKADIEVADAEIEDENKTEENTAEESTETVTEATDSESKETVSSEEPAEEAPVESGITETVVIPENAEAIKLEGESELVVPEVELPAEETSEEGLLEDEELELLEAKDDEDFNEDGLSDLKTKLLCDGTILTRDGKRAFGNLSYEEVQSKDDLDGDGLLNGAEVVIEKDGDTEYAVLKSDPCKLDTDGDGIYDADDTAPWERGLEGGVLGSVRLVARHDDSTGDPTHGHVYIVYTSYVNNLEITIDKLYGYYVANPDYKEILDAACDNPDGSVVSWRSTADEITEANEPERAAAAQELYIEQNHEKLTSGTVVLNRGDYISIGNYGMASIQERLEQNYIPAAMKIFGNDYQKLADFWNAATGKNADEEYVREHQAEILAILQKDGMLFVDYVVNGTTDGGVWINRELFNQKYAYDQGPNEVIEREATAADLNVMLSSFAANSYFNLFTHNCSTVGSTAWNDTYGYERDENGQIVKDENGAAVKTEYYVHASYETQIGKFDFPMLVKNSIKSMAALPGYIGQMTYVTGKKLVNTINEAVKSFDVSKLFGKKAKTEETKPAQTEEIKSQSTSKSSSSSSGSATSTPANFERVVTVLTSTAGTEDLNTSDDTAAKPVKTKITRVAAVETEAEEEVVEEAEKEIVQESSLQEEEEEADETTIQDEETPVAIEKSHTPIWVWLVVAVAAAFAGAGVFVFVRKKN